MQARSPTAFPFVCDNPMDMQFGPDGNLYLLTYGDGFFSANPDAGLSGASTSRAPRRRTRCVKATPTYGPAPLTVQFSSAGSGDDDAGDSITFAWDFDGNGTRRLDRPEPESTYTARTASTRPG